MSFQWIADHGRATDSRLYTIGDRRRDHATAEKIRDALRACSTHAAAQALACQQIDLATALRVLARPEWRRARER